MVPNLQVPETLPTDQTDTTPHPDAELIELDRALKFAPLAGVLALLHVPRHLRAQSSDTRRPAP